LAQALGSRSVRRFSVPSVVLRFDPNRSNGELEPSDRSIRDLSSFS